MFGKLRFFISIFLLLTPFIFARPIETAGDYGQVLLPVSAAAISLLMKDRPGTLQFAETYSATFVTVHVVKHAINSRRPNGGAHSFPSGHTASSFAAATFLQLRYGWMFGVPATIAAIFVGYSRIEARKHWVYDVFAGAAIGIGYNLLITRPYRVRICPCIDAESTSLSVNVSW